VRADNDAKRRADPGAAQGARVAVGQDLSRIWHQVRPGGGHRLARLAVLALDPARLVDERPMDEQAGLLIGRCCDRLRVADDAEHPIDGPREVHGRRAGGAQAVARTLEMPLQRRGGMPGRRRGERETPRGRDADDGRAPHGERPDRLGDLVHGAALEIRLASRQRTLVEDPDRVASPHDWRGHFAHAGVLASRTIRSTAASRVNAWAYRPCCRPATHPCATEPGGCA
jgi:hypothetical protein